MKRFIYCSLVLVLFSTGINSCKKKNDEPVAQSPPPLIDDVPAIDTMNYDMDEKTVTDEGWTKVMEEGFGTDLSNWNIWQSGAYNNEYQYYSNSPENINLKDGILTITAIKKTVTGNKEPGNNTQKTFDFTSARIESKSTISANNTTRKVRLSARLKLAAGYGMWPAFWSYGDAWPTNGEIDVIESKGNLPFVYGTNYFYGSTAGTNQVPSNSGLDQTMGNDLTKYWHVYEVIWEETKLTFLLNGKVIRTLTSSTAPGQYIDDMFGKTQNIALNLAVGGDYFGNPAPATIETGSMYVDWVKVFTSN